LGNGAGPALFVGRTRQSKDSRRRALLAFDVASAIPAAAQVVSVTLRLTLIQTHAGEEPIALHRVLAAWGEGESKTPGGRGAPGGGGERRRCRVMRPGSIHFFQTSAGPSPAVIMQPPPAQS